METFDVYVANLALEHTEDYVRSIFDIAGEIHSVKILPPREGMFGKIAYVRYKSEDDAECAAKYLHNIVLEDKRVLQVRYRKKEQYSSNSEASNCSAKNGHEITNSNDTDRYSAIDTKEKSGSSEEKEIKTVLVVHVESPVKFWTQSLNPENLSNIEKATLQLQNLCPSQPKVVGHLSTQQIYACKFSLDDMWYRCVVEKCTQNTAQVRYIDYGNCESTDRFSLVTLPPSLATLPQLAECCHLKDLGLVDEDPNSELFKQGREKLNEKIIDQAIDLKMLYREKQTQYVEVLKIHDGEVMDIKSDLIQTGSVKIKIQAPRKPTKTSLTGLRNLLLETCATNYDNIKEREDKIKNFQNGFSLVPPNPPFSKASISASSLEEKPSSQQLFESSDSTKTQQREIQPSQNTVQILEGKLAALKLQNEKEVKDLVTKLSEIEKQKQAEITALKEKFEKDAALKKPVTRKLTTLSQKVKSVRTQRGEVSLSNDSNPRKILKKACDLYANIDNVISLKDIPQYQNVLKVQEAVEIQKGLITACTDAEETQELVEGRDDLLQKLSKCIRSFLKHVDTLPVAEREQELSDMLELLTNNYPNLIGHTPCKYKSLDAAVAEYTVEREEKLFIIRTLQKCSNDHSSKLFKTFGQMQREFHCSVSPITQQAPEDIDQIIDDYIVALDKELQETQVVKYEVDNCNSFKNVIMILNETINTELKDIAFLRNEYLKEQYERQINKYKCMIKKKPDTSLITTTRKNIKQLKSKYRHKQADITDVEEDSDGADEKELMKHEKELEEIRFELHQQLVVEMKELVKLARDCQGDYPELLTLHPELLLSSFLDSGFLLQKSRTLDHYPQEMVTLATRPDQITFKTTFNGKDCVLKELSANNKTFEEVFSSVVKYTKEKHELWTNFKCVYTDKMMRKLYIHEDYASEGNILQFLRKHHATTEIIKSLLKDVLKSLDKPECVHGAIKPENILVEKREDGTFFAIMSEPNLMETKESQQKKCLGLHKTINNYPPLESFQRETYSHKTDVALVAALFFWALYRDSFSGDLEDIKTITKDVELSDMFGKLLEAEPSERLSALDAMKLPLFRDITVRADTAKEDEESKESQAEEEMKKSVASDVQNNEEKRWEYLTKPEQQANTEGDVNSESDSDINHVSSFDMNAQNDIINEKENGIEDEVTSDSDTSIVATAANEDVDILPTHNTTVNEILDEFEASIFESNAINGCANGSSSEKDIEQSAEEDTGSEIEAWSEALKMRRVVRRDALEEKPGISSDEEF